MRIEPARLRRTGRPRWTWRRTFLTALLASLPGCGEPIAPFDGEHDFTVALTSGDTTRTALVHVGRSYDGSRRLPLVLAFHGSFGSGQNMRLFSGLDAIADDLGFIVAYPDAIPNWDYEGEPDLDFTRDLIAHLAGRLGVAPDRVYAAGMSRGGLFALHLACRLPRNFGAVGVVAATLREDLSRGCDRAARLPLVLAVGSEDGSTPLEGAPRAGYLSADATSRVFAGRNGCDLGAPRGLTWADDTVDDARRVRFERFTGCRDGAATELWVMEGAGHEWYRGDVDISRALAAFFLAHAR
jgi:polyhydroxybutyrate depolymerase